MKKSKFAKVCLLLVLGTALTSCDSEIINLPSDKESPIITVSNDNDNDVTDNNKEVIYSDIKSGQSINEKQLQIILENLAKEKYLVGEFALDDADVKEKVEDKLMEVARGSSYNDTFYRFQEYKYALSLIKDGYTIKTKSGSTALSDIEAASNLLLVTPETEYDEVFKLDYSDYIDRTLKPEITRQYLIAYYIYQNTYSAIGTTAARNITAVKIADRDDKPGEAYKLVSSFASLIKAASTDETIPADDFDLKNLSNLWKKDLNDDDNKAFIDKYKATYPLLSSFTNLQNQLQDKLDKIADSVTFDEEGEIDSITLKSPYTIDSSVYSELTGSNAYSVKKGYKLAKNKLQQEKNYYDDTYLKSDSISELPDDVKTALFNNDYNRYTWSFTRGDQTYRYVVATRSEDKNDIAIYSSSAYYIVQVNTMVSTVGIAKSDSDSDEVKAEKRKLAMEAAYKMAEQDTNKKNAITWFLTNNTIDYSDPDFYDYIDTNYPDAIDDD